MKNTQSKINKKLDSEVIAILLAGRQLSRLTGGNREHATDVQELLLRRNITLRDTEEGARWSTDDTARAEE